MSAQSCKTCRHLVVSPDAAGRRVVRKNRVYTCRAPLPEMPALPDCITRSYGFKSPAKTGRRNMAGDDGQACPVWAALASAGEGANT